MSRPANGATKRRLLAEIEASGVSDRRVLEALGTVPRERFVPERLRAQAYENTALPIQQDQTISQPIVVAQMAHAADLKATDHVLEIGCGSGYGAAVLGQLAGDVVTVEILPTLAAEAAKLLAELGYDNVHVVVGDGSLGWPALAPYDAIVITAAAPHAPPLILSQLKENGGRLVAPIGQLDRQQLIRADRIGNRFRVQILGEVRFVPLVGAAGFAVPDHARRN